MITKPLLQLVIISIIHCLPILVIRYKLVITLYGKFSNRTHKISIRNVLTKYIPNVFLNYNILIVYRMALVGYSIQVDHRT